MERAGEKVSQIIVRQKRACIFSALLALIYVKGSCYETPLYDHVLGNKRDSEKDEVWERGGAQGRGGGGRRKREGLRE